MPAFTQIVALLSSRLYGHRRLEKGPICSQITGSGSPSEENGGAGSGPPRLQRSQRRRTIRSPQGGMMNRPTIMPKTKVALTLDAALIEQVDELVERRRFRNRSQAVEAALADKLR